MSLFSAGIANGWNSPSIPILTDEKHSPIPMTADQGSWLIQISILGIIISVFPAGKCSDRWFVIVYFHSPIISIISFVRI